MRPGSVVFVLVMLAARPSGAAPGRDAPVEAGAEQQPPPMSPAMMAGSIPRWPFIAGAGLVFVGMALRGLRRRS